MNRPTIPPAPTNALTKKFNEEIARQINASLGTSTDIAILKTDNQHNKTHIKALAAFAVILTGGAILGAATIYCNLTDQIKNTESRFEEHSNRTEDRLSSRITRLENNMDARLNGGSFHTPEQLQNNNTPSQVISPNNKIIPQN